MQQSIQVTGLDHSHSLFLGSHSLVHQIAGDLQGSLCSSLAVPGLQHVELFILNGELHILHIPVVVLKLVAHILELLEHLRHNLFHLCDGHRSTDTCHHVLALGIHQELAHKLLLAGCRIPGKCNAGAGLIGPVSESHHLHVYGSSPGIRNVVVPAVHIGSGVVPGTEHGLHGAHQLLLGIIREILSDLGFVLSLELICKLLQICRRELHIHLDAPGCLHLVNQFLKILLADFHYDVGVHLDKPSIAVPRPSLIASLSGDGVDHGLIQAQVQDGIHHARHGCPGTGAHRHKQRILGIAELLAGDLLHFANMLIDLPLDLVVDLLPVLIVLSTSVRGDRESLRHRQPQLGHLRQVCTLAAEKLTHIRIALRKQVHPFLHIVSPFHIKFSQP